MEKIRPACWIDIDDINEVDDSDTCVIADVSKYQVYDGDVPLYTREALEAVAKAVLEEVSRIAMIDGNVDIAAIVNEMTEE